MTKSELRNYRIEKFEFVNKTTGIKRIELTHKYSYNVGYAGDNTCRGEFTANIFDKETPDSFHINITVVGIFNTVPGREKEFLHLETYDMLFPYVKALVATMTAASGVAPVNIPYIDISDRNIYRMEIPHKPDNN